MLDRNKVEGLPAAGIADELSEALSESGVVVVTAPPGAGKSTVLPLTLLESVEGSILMLEPRRIAARQIAVRMSSLLGEKPGQTVGYRVRFESCVSEKTRLEVLTEGILTRMLSEDPTLDGVGAVIFDEFHERSLNADVALTLTRENARLLRPDLKIVIMSATIDASSLCAQVGAAHVHCEGRMFPVDIRYASVDVDEREAVAAVAREICIALKETDGDVLAFLPGEADIRRCVTSLQSLEMSGLKILPLFGMLPFDQQKAALEPSGGGERKVVIATSIAETSLTIPGVRVVVDSGFCRRMVTDPLTGLSRMETVRISADMADQRAGRAGRVAPGQCRRLWTPATNHRLQARRVPEILSSDLTRTALDLAVWGCSDPSALPWIDSPRTSSWAVAQSALGTLGAIGENHIPTPFGVRLSALPCHPRIGSMLLSALPSELETASDMAAILEDRDPLDLNLEGVDISLRINALRSSPSGGGISRIREASQQFRRLILGGRVRQQLGKCNSDPWTCGKLLSRAFPERVARLRPEGLGQYLLSDGTAVRMEINDPLSSSEWIVAASASVSRGREGRIFLAAPVSAEDLSGISRSRDNIFWDPSREAVSARHEVNVGCLLLSSCEIPSPDPAAVKSVLCDALKRSGSSLLDFSEDVNALLRRISFVAERHPELVLPDLSISALLSDPSRWLDPYIDGLTTKSQLRKLDLRAIIFSMLNYQQQRDVERLAPEYLTVPTGSRIRLEYRQGADAPVLRVRLQECFGLLDTPTVDDGRQKVLMELLSPGFKPVQLTSDLRSFWSEAYFEVRSELRRRYPRHSWPDNPLDAAPVRVVKKRK